MSCQSKVEELAPQAAGETVSREWLIDDDSTRQLYMSLVAAGQPSSSPTKDTKDSPKGAKQSDQAPKVTNPGIAAGRTREQEASSKPQSSTKLVLGVLCVLACATLAWQALSRTTSPTAESSAVAHLQTTLGSQRGIVSPAGTAGMQGFLSVTPTVIMAQCEPGKSTEQTLTIDNQTPSEFTFEVGAEDLVAQDGKAFFVLPGAAPNGIAATAVFSQKYFNVKPRQTTSITVTFTVHPQTPARGILVVFHGTDKVSVGGTLTMTASFGTLITVAAPASSLAGIPGAEMNPQTPTTAFSVSQWITEPSAQSVPPRDEPSAVNSEETPAGKTPLPSQSAGGQQP